MCDFIEDYFLGNKKDISSSLIMQMSKELGE
jgi:hypothetical protein